MFKCRLLTKVYRRHSPTVVCVHGEEGLFSYKSLLVPAFSSSVCYVTEVAFRLSSFRESSQSCLVENDSTSALRTIHVTEDSARRHSTLNISWTHCIPLHQLHTIQDQQCCGQSILQGSLSALTVSLRHSEVLQNIPSTPRNIKSI